MTRLYVTVRPARAAARTALRDCFVACGPGRHADVLEHHVERSAAADGVHAGASLSEVWR